MAKRIQFVGRDVGPDVRFDEIEYFGREAAGDAHFLDFFRGFDVD